MYYTPRTILDPDSPYAAKAFWLYGNFDYAGTEKFKWHVHIEGERATLCGLYLKQLRGDWQFEDFNSDHIHCAKCKKSYGRLLLPTARGRVVLTGDSIRD